MMARALELAQKGIGYVNPNPLVGAVIVKDGKIIGEGYHEAYGLNHAEINAFNHANTALEGATMYVSLEPCAHFGKTPPCAQAIVDKKIKEVYIASVDPNPLVAGKGIEILKNAGIKVHVGLLDEENKRLNKVFFKYINEKMPYVLLKNAMSLDGKIATKTGDSKWISNEKSRAYVHGLRHRFQAIMVGANTVIKDNPLLTTRLNNYAGRNPIRIVIDIEGITPLESHLLLTANQIKTIVVTTPLCDDKKLKQMTSMGAETIVLSNENQRINLKELMKILSNKGIDSILLEGGGMLSAAALEAGIVDEITTFIAPKVIGGLTAMSPIGGLGIDHMHEAIKLKVIEYKWFDDDIMISYQVEKGC